MSRKPILCLDFDGVIHSYSSGWQGADCIPDPAVPGAVEFIAKAVETFTISIFSSRSNQRMGIEAMQFWLKLQFYRAMEAGDADPILAALDWPKEKPPAMVTIDDRALTFSGRWTDYDPAGLLAFQPWNKRDAALARPRAAVEPWASHVTIAREAVAAMFEEDDQASLAQGVRAGREDHCSPMQAALRALRLLNPTVADRPRAAVGEREA